MARQLARLGLMSVIVLALVTGSAQAFWVSCTSTHQSMSNIAYNTPYDITTEAGRDTGDPSYYSINYNQVALYSLITGGSGDGNWHLKGTCNTTSTTWNVVNLEHDIYVSWESRINVYDVRYSTYVTTYSSGNPGPYYTS